MVEVELGLFPADHALGNRADDVFEGLVVNDVTVLAVEQQPAFFPSAFGALVGVGFVFVAVAFEVFRV
jgi:hypothetical protein